MEKRQCAERHCVSAEVEQSSGDLDVAIRPVPYPPGKLQLLCFLDDEPAKSNTLHAAADFEVDRVHLR